MPCGVRSDIDTFAGSCFFDSFTVDVEHFYNCAKAIVVSCERHDLDCPPNLNAVKGPDSREIARALSQNLRQEALVSL
jgi:hypothetical protein